VRRKTSYKMRQKVTEAPDKAAHYPMYTTGPKVMISTSTTGLNLRGLLCDMYVQHWSKILFSTLSTASASM
jgi:hypothetical protein